MEKAVLDFSYTDKNKKLYDSFIKKLQSEGWQLESTFINHMKGKGKYSYRTLIRRNVI